MAAVAASAIFAYLNGLGGDFVFDDNAFLIDNPKLDGFFPASYFFTQDVWFYSNVTDAESAIYRPVTILFVWACAQLGINGALEWHLVSLSFHVFATLALLVTMRRTMPGISPLAAGIAAGLFAIHPVHAEVVAWASGTAHALVTLFLLAAYFFHDRSHQSARTLNAAYAVVFFTLAIFTFEMAVAFPLFILLHDRIRHGGFSVFRNLPYFAVLGLYMIARNQVLGQSLPLDLTSWDRWSRLPLFLAEYLRHLVLPWPQPLYLDMPERWGISLTTILVSALWVLVVIAVLKLPESKRRKPSIALLWIFVSLLPPLAASFTQDARFALRSLYLPSVGLAMLVAWAVDAYPLFRRRVGTLVLSGVFLLGFLGTVAANRDWHDDGKVYGKIVTWNPLHPAGYSGLGRFYERTGKTDKALAQYEASLSMAYAWQMAEPLQLLATLHGKSGNTQHSLELFKQLALLEPGNAAAWNGQGNNHWALGDFEAAYATYLRGHEADPSDKVACYNLVLVLERLGRHEEAAQYARCSQGAN